ncbi:helicase associated domain-containing protein [Streptomyces sp. Wh19]
MGVKLGAWLDNVRKRAAKLSAERRAELDEFGMRWASRQVEGNVR